METTKDIEVIKTVNVIYPSQEVYEEVQRFLTETGGVAGRVFLRAMLTHINREKKAGRWGV